MSNRFHLVPRERLHGVIEGVDYGYNLSCLARSPALVLLWSAGTAYTSGRMTRYGTSTMYAIPRRSTRRIADYDRVGPDGGRLSVARVEACRDVIVGLFDGETFTWIRAAAARRMTLLVEGGGPPLMPSRKLGEEAYRTWRALPERGLV